MEEKKFEIETVDKILYVQCLNLERSIFIWVGDSRGAFDNLSLASCTPITKIPSTAQLLGPTISQSLTQKLCKRLQKQVILSYNIQSEEIDKQYTEDLVLKHLIETLTS